MPRLTLVSYNVSWGVQKDDASSSEGAWVEACRRGGGCRARVAQFLRDADADVVLLQEFVPSAELVAALRGYDLVRWRSGREEAAIALRRDAVGDGARVVARASIGERSGRPALAVYLPRLAAIVATVHAGHDAPRAQRDLADFVGAAVRAAPAAARSVVVGGDFNARIAAPLAARPFVLHPPRRWPQTCCRGRPWSGAGDGFLYSGGPPVVRAERVPGSDHDPVRTTVRLGSAPRVRSAARRSRRS